MNIRKSAIGTIALYAATVISCWGAVPTIERARELFSPENIADPNLDFYWGSEYNDFHNLLWTSGRTLPQDERIQMKDFFLTTLTSIVVRVSTNTVDDGTVHYRFGQDRVVAFSRALMSFGDAFETNVTDCLAIASYIDRVHLVPFSESLIWRRGGPIVIYNDPKKREAWEHKRQEQVAKEKPIRELQLRVFTDNGYVRDYRDALFDLCNSCVLANRRVMGDDDFAAFTNRVVELSKPSDAEKRRLFAHLDEVKRK